MMLNGPEFVQQSERVQSAEHGAKSVLRRDGNRIRCQQPGARRFWRVVALPNPAVFSASLNDG